jgi:predicted 3-demethylubiquinone-9 3-methyltransferase (glyoxalase superfamily)
MQKITPFLWFDGKAEEAANFYVSVFKNSKILNLTRLPSGPSEGKAIVSFEIEGQKFTALDGGPHFQINPAISFVVDCKTQDEVDYFWDRLCEGGQPVQCGWLTDKYGVSWQIVPSVLPELISSDDQEKSARVMNAMMEMIKLDISALEAAAAAPSK